MTDAVKWILGQSAMVAFLIGFIIYREREFKAQNKAKDELLRDMMEKLFELFKDGQEKDVNVIHRLNEFEKCINEWFRR